MDAQKVQPNARMYKDEYLDGKNSLRMIMIEFQHLCHIDNEVESLKLDHESLVRMLWYWRYRQRAPGTVHGQFIHQSMRTLYIPRALNLRPSPDDEVRFGVGEISKHSPQVRRFWDSSLIESNANRWHHQSVYIDLSSLSFSKEQWTKTRLTTMLDDGWKGIGRLPLGSILLLSSNALGGRNPVQMTLAASIASVPQAKKNQKREKDILFFVLGE